MVEGIGRGSRLQAKTRHGDCWVQDARVAFPDAVYKRFRSDLGGRVARRRAGLVIVACGGHCHGREAENVFQYLAGGQAGHNDHRAKGDVLEGHRQAVIAAIAGHHLGLGAKVAQVEGWRHRHVTILPQPETAAQ